MTKDLSPIFLLLALGAFLVLDKAFASTTSDTPNAEEKDEPSRPNGIEDSALRGGAGDDVDPVDLSLPDGILISTFVENMLEVQISDVAQGILFTALQITAAFGPNASAEDL